MSFLLLSADADFAPWPVATYDNGTVVVSGHTAGIHLAPVAGHTAKVLGDLEVQGALEVQGVDVLDVLQALSPPVCDGANEKLQFHFNAHIFLLELEIYKKEKLNVDSITFKDNQGCLDLIEARTTGLLAMALELAGDKSSLTLVTEVNSSGALNPKFGATLSLSP